MYAANPAKMIRMLFSRRIVSSFPFPIATLALLAIAVAALPQENIPGKLSRQAFARKLSASAVERTNHIVRYDPAYVRIPYPGGDVPAETGVCTDEIIRSYRALGIDLQKEAHEDMTRNFSAYPNQLRWGLAHTDSNIDHRRVPNLMAFFSRNAESLDLSNRARDYFSGDLVTWDLGGGVPHIGIVVDRKSASTGRLMVVHNIGRGPKNGRSSLPMENYRPLPLL